MTETRPDRILGPGHDDFWRWCDQGELRLQACDGCGKLAWPVVTTCEVCGEDRFTWQAMSGRGRLVSWCTFEHDYYKGVFPIPYETILVELEEGPLFISNPVGLTWGDMEMGIPMKLAFLSCRDSHGLFQLPVFERT